MTEIELRPCPFCGSAARSGDGFAPVESTVYAYCSNNECYLHSIDVGFSPEDWNTRAETPMYTPIGWFTDDHLTDRSATTYDVDVAAGWSEKGWPVSTLYILRGQSPRTVTVSRALLQNMCSLIPEKMKAARKKVRSALMRGKSWIQ